MPPAASGPALRDGALREARGGLRAHALVRGAERPACGRDAELRALKEGRPWPNADDSAELVPIPDASRMRPDTS